MRDRQCDPFVTDSAGHEIYLGQTVYYWQGRVMCLDCFQDEITDMLDNDPDGLAELVGADVYEIDSNQTRGHR